MPVFTYLIYNKLQIKYGGLSTERLRLEGFIFQEVRIALAPARLSRPELILKDGKSSAR
jgi:hypothetical protein